jgi:hypothetical protein
VQIGRDERARNCGTGHSSFPLSQTKVYSLH